MGETVDELDSDMLEDVEDMLDEIEDDWLELELETTIAVKLLYIVNREDPPHYSISLSFVNSGVRRTCHL